jgi:uncharacterized repeat protein (TIGR03803 family)
MSITRRIALATLIAGGTVPLAANAGTFTTLYSFTGKKDGGYPYGPIIYQGGELYGTTIAGKGNVFKVNATTGDFKVVYTFQGGTDGNVAAGGVTYQNGMLYGTTRFGGGGCDNQGCGTIFSVNAETGDENVLYSFSQDCNCTTPVGPGTLVYLNGTFYGTTVQAGTNYDGSVFTYNVATGSFSNLYSFGGGTDGVTPNPQLLYQNNLLYGTTLFGNGSSCHTGGLSCGTLFTVDPTTGAEAILYAFTQKKRGVRPISNLVYHAGSLFGATEAGGIKPCRCGSSYKVKVGTGRETVIEEFQDGQNYTGVTLVGGNAYETLPSGGANGAGELLEVDLQSGQQTVLYSFTGGADGSQPRAQLLYHDGAFYGTTIGGNGSVFEYVP